MPVSMAQLPPSPVDSQDLDMRLPLTEYLYETTSLFSSVVFRFDSDNHMLFVGAV